MFARCQRQPENARRAAERRINNELKRFIKRGKRIAIYWAIGSELRLDSFARTAQQRGAQVYLPYIAQRSLKLWFTPHPIMRQGSLKAAGFNEVKTNPPSPAQNEATPSQPATGALKMVNGKITIVKKTK